MPQQTKWLLALNAGLVAMNLVPLTDQAWNQYYLDFNKNQWSIGHRKAFPSESWLRLAMPLKKSKPKLSHQWRQCWQTLGQLANRRLKNSWQQLTLKQVEKRRDEIDGWLIQPLGNQFWTRWQQGDARHPFEPNPVKYENSWKLPNVMAETKNVVLITLPLVKKEENLVSLPIWTSCLLVVAGKRTV